jgi:hypothetical protein
MRLYSCITVDVKSVASDTSGYYVLQSVRVMKSDAKPNKPIRCKNSINTNDRNVNQRQVEKQWIQLCE